MSRPRIVLDTNVLVSAAVKPQGWQAMVLQLVAFRAGELFVSEAILAEYREVSQSTIRTAASMNGAEAAAADYIVTGNARRFTQGHGNTRIITGRQLLELLTGGQV